MRHLVATITAAVVAFGSIATVAVPSLAAPPPPPPRYSFLDLGTFGGDQSEARAISDNGRVTGWAWTAAQSAYREYDFRSGQWVNETGFGGRQLPNAFLYDSQAGRMVNLGRDGEASAGEAISNGNRVIGTVGLADNLKRAFRLSFGPLDERVDDSFFHPEIRASVAWDINDRNQIVGNTYLPGGHGAFVYRNNEMVSLGNLLGAPSWARAINDDGLVAGDSFLNPNYTGAIHAVVHDTRSGQTRDLRVLATQPRPYPLNSHAWDISEGGLAVGTSHADGALGAEHAFLHDGTRMFDLGTLPGDFRSDAYALRACLTRQRYVRAETLVALWRMLGRENCADRKNKTYERSSAVVLRSLTPSPGTPGEGWGEGSVWWTLIVERHQPRRTLTLPSPGVPGEGKLRGRLRPHPG